MSESEALETTNCRSRSSSSEVHALQLFIRLVAISSAHARFRVLEAAGLSFFASAFAARFLLIDSSISFCPAAALRGFLPFAGSAPRSLRCCASGHPSGRQRFRPLAAPSQQSACRYASAPSSSTCCARPPRARPKPSASQSAKSSEHSRPPNAPTISETQPMPDPKSIML